MPDAAAHWAILPPATIPVDQREEHVRCCSDFAADLLVRHPGWRDSLDERAAPRASALSDEIGALGLDPGLRYFRNREMLRIVWRDLCGLATLGETFASLTSLAEICLQAAIAEHRARLADKHGIPRGEDGREIPMFVIGLGKFGGGELNLSSDIDIMFCHGGSGQCDGRRGLAAEQFFTRLARAVIASLGEVTAEGFCFRVDTRLRPFGEAGPITASMASLEQYYQREGRDWERYALVKARPVAGDLAFGARFIDIVRPFVYRRYIDYGAVEALQEMHANVREDARRRDRLDDIKRGPGGIREIEFLVQCFQILRGGREPGLQTPSLEEALAEIGRIGLLESTSVQEMRHDYAYLRFLENRIQALHDQQTHRLPAGPDRERIARAMYEDSVEALEQSLARTRNRVSKRFQAIFPERPAEPAQGGAWTEYWRRYRARRQDAVVPETAPGLEPLEKFLHRLDRVALSHRAHERLDRFMPLLLQRLEGHSPATATLHRVFDLVLAVCRRSAYLALLVQQPGALDRMLELFERSAWIAERVTRFPALLDELIDPLLGEQIPDDEELQRSVARILSATDGTEALLEALNYLKLATTLRIAVGFLQGRLAIEAAHRALAGLADAVLGALLRISAREIADRHGELPGAGPAPPLGIIGYGSLGARELGLESDLDVVFLFEAGDSVSDGARPLPAERYCARIARRVLSFLTVMTPSGRLYPVDTRLRPNGRAGSLVASTRAFHDYQLNEAWTWEMQALTRARFIAGSPGVAARFNRSRQEALCRRRDTDKLARELLEMRRKISHEQTSRTQGAAKYRSGGLLDIEFVAQFGVLASARQYPRVVRTTGTLGQIEELRAISWLSGDEAPTLSDTVRRLWRQRMLSTLAPQEAAGPIDTGDAARIFARKLGSLDATPG